LLRNSSIETTDTPFSARILTPMKIRLSQLRSIIRQTILTEEKDRKLKSAWWITPTGVPEEFAEGYYHTDIGTMWALGEYTDEETKKLAYDTDPDEPDYEPDEYSSIDHEKMETDMMKTKGFAKARLWKNGRLTLGAWTVTDEHLAGLKSIAASSGLRGDAPVEISQESPGKAVQLTVNDVRRAYSAADLDW